jgi:hypothetical protein
VVCHERMSVVAAMHLPAMPAEVQQQVQPISHGMVPFEAKRLVVPAHGNEVQATTRSSMNTVATEILATPWTELPPVLQSGNISAQSSTEHLDVVDTVVDMYYQRVPSEARF